ncbi:hypothetical protein [Streptomyces sp. NEAU-174]|uniref:hypothetical protein n=1 Tax=Streptomyces sp. NEAU-174 TaxID=3458254 RepID=UPI00404439AA
MSLDAAPAYRIRLSKEWDNFLLVVDDESGYSRLVNEDDIPERRVLSVERVAAHPVEATMQRNALDEELFEAPYKILTYTARSEAHAAGLALRDHHEEWALLALDDVFYADENAFPGIAAHFHRGD